MLLDFRSSQLRLQHLLLDRWDSPPWGLLLGVVRLGPTLALEMSHAETPLLECSRLVHDMADMAAFEILTRSDPSVYF